MKNLHTQAIASSLNSDWEIAIELNSLILKDEPNNIAALNRLARAYTELNQKESAKTVYNKVLALDKYNQIALKNLKLLPNKNTASDICLSSEDFIDESGLTKTVQLIKIADKNTLLSVTCKQTLSFVPRSRLIAINTLEGSYLGCLPDDLSLKLNKYLKSGYKYSVCLKSATEGSVHIFIRETKRPNRPTAGATFARFIKLPKLK